MPLYRITDLTTNRPMGLFSATSERDALDMCARAHGCSDYLSSQFCLPDGRRALQAELMSAHGPVNEWRQGLTAMDQLREAMRWLSMQSPELALGLRCAEDAIALWRGWHCDNTVPDQLVTPSNPDEARTLRRFFTRTIGYSPIPLPKMLPQLQ